MSVAVVNCLDVISPPRYPTEHQPKIRYSTERLSISDCFCFNNERQACNYKRRDRPSNSPQHIKKTRKPAPPTPTDDVSHDNFAH